MAVKAKGHDLPGAGFAHFRPAGRRPRLGPMPRPSWIAPILGVLFLAAQVVAVADQHRGPTRYFAWAPNDYVVEYDLRVQVDGRPLDAAQIDSRYGRLYGASAGSTGDPYLRGVWEFPPEQLIDIVRQYEQTYGRQQHAHVLLDYRLDGGARHAWTWDG